MYNQFDIIVGVCETSRFNLLKWIRHSQVVAIPNAIQWEVFNKAKPFEKNELGLPHSSFMITMTARFFFSKRPTNFNQGSFIVTFRHTCCFCWLW